MESKHKKIILQIFLPVLAGLLIPFLCYQIDLWLNPLDPIRNGDGAMFLASVFNYFLLPVILIILILIQVIFILPFWIKFSSIFRNILLRSIIISVVFALLTGFLLGYLFWVKQFGMHDLFISTLISSCIMLVYFIGNVTTLYFLDKSYTSVTKSHT
jgi:hypothetical protein